MERVNSIASHSEKRLSSSAVTEYLTPLLFPSSPSSSSSSSSTTTVPRVLKRHRSCADVDGEGSGNKQKKKRRLRLQLVTSRLSRLYATPATHIIGRQASKFSAWARSRTPGDGFFRKAALLNQFRIKKAIPKHPGRCCSEVAHRLLCDGRRKSSFIAMTANSSCRYSHPPPRSLPQPLIPSPFGLPNHDDLDEHLDLYEGRFDDARDDEPINSDFSIMGPDETSMEELGVFEGRVSES